MLSNLESIARFVTIVEEGTMRRAAERRGVTQAALTRSLKLLEDSVGAALFDRRARGLHLTQMGHEVLQQARHLLREVQLSEAEIRARHAGERGLLRLSAAPVWLWSVIPSILPQVHKTYPGLTFELTAQNYEEAIPLLKNGECDAFFGGFQKVEPLPSFLVRTPMFTARLAVAARKSHPLMQQDQVTLHDLLNCNWISFQNDVAYLDTLNAIIHRQTGETIKAAIHCDSMLPALELLRHGNYVSLLPSNFVNHLYGDGVGILSLNIDDISFQSGPIYRRGLNSNSAFKLLLDLAQKRVSDLGLEDPYLPDNLSRPQTT
ncbi:LysR family transcriptional regulator [Cognatishimia sp. WU-CL00825]|uniref:LysR family transcriptional regulator n=1 Tax=Cognatishimia sp. WU-CL00825 TaxID=3127658 RepID=UPI00310B3926